MFATANQKQDYDRNIGELIIFSLIKYIIMITN